MVRKLKSTTRDTTRDRCDVDKPPLSTTTKSQRRAHHNNANSSAACLGTQRQKEHITFWWLRSSTLSQTGPFLRTDRGTESKRRNLEASVRYTQPRVKLGGLALIDMSVCWNSVDETEGLFWWYWNNTLSHGGVAEMAHGRARVPRSGATGQRPGDTSRWNTSNKKTMLRHSKKSGREKLLKYFYFLPLQWVQGSVIGGVTNRWRWLFFIDCNFFKYHVFVIVVVAL